MREITFKFLEDRAMQFAQSFLTWLGICLVVASVALVPSVAYAEPYTACQDSNCFACLGTANKFDVCPHDNVNACSCECTGKTKPYSCNE